MSLENERTTIDKAEITQQLQTLVEERLFGTKPWPTTIHDNLAIHQQLLDWGLIVEIDKEGTYKTTALGREFSVDHWSLFMGYHELSEIPDLLVECGLLTMEEANHIIFDRWERDGEELEVVLPPILRRVYRDNDQRRAIKERGTA
jgi:hypothetical protein